MTGVFRPPSIEPPVTCDVTCPRDTNTEFSTVARPCGGRLQRAPEADVAPAFMPHCYSTNNRVMVWEGRVSGMWCQEFGYRCEACGTIVRRVAMLAPSPSGYRVEDLPEVLGQERYDRLVAQGRL